MFQIIIKGSIINKVMYESRTLLLFQKVNNISITPRKCINKIMDESRTLVWVKKSKYCKEIIRLLRWCDFL